jgi:hypothetical protein
MKRSANKSNLEIVRNYYEGTRPFTQVGYNPILEDKNRKEGEEWVDSHGHKWKIENGYRKRISKNAKIIIEKRCKGCNADTRWGNYLDDRVWPKTGFCYNCFVNNETKMKIAGVWENFNTLRDLKNTKSYILDTKSKLEETKQFCELHQGEPIQFHEEDGTIERWSGVEDYSKILNDVNKDLELINERLLSIDSEILEHETVLKEKNIKF